MTGLDRAWHGIAFVVFVGHIDTNSAQPAILHATVMPIAVASD
jgi:hypothetical protein